MKLIGERGFAIHLSQENYVFVEEKFFPPPLKRIGY